MNDELYTEMTLQEEIEGLPPTVPDYVKKRMIDKLNSEYVQEEDHEEAINCVKVECKGKIKEMCRMYDECNKHLMEAYAIMLKIKRLAE